MDYSGLLPDADSETARKRLVGAEIIPRRALCGLAHRPTSRYNTQSIHSIPKFLTGPSMRTVFWDYDRNLMRMIDQRLLPFETAVPDYETYEEVAEGIREMVVRGAPAIGAVAAFGMVLAAQQSRATDRLALLRDLE